MTDSLPRGSFTPLEWGLAKQNAPATSTFVENYTGHALGEIEQEWQVKVRSLQMLICELLLKNQQLRIGLEARTATSREQIGQADD